MTTHNQRPGSSRFRLRSCIPVVGLLAVTALILNALLTDGISSKLNRYKMSNKWKQTVNHWMQPFISNATKMHFSGTMNAGEKVKIKKCPEQFQKNHLMTISYSGRTGNLLFQLASLLAVANMTCFTPVVTPAHLIFLDSIFDLRNIERTPYNPSTFKLIPEHGYAIYQANVTSQVSPDSNWTLGGYRQSFRYFANHVNLVKSSFQFKESVKKDVLEYINDNMFRNKTKVCLHVRRGDIALDRKTELLSDLAYFNRAINYMKKHLSPLTFELIVVSDGMPWCRKTITGEHVHYSPFWDAGRDLYLLTQCDHYIITIGTFSWMGAWLNETGLVIYDKKPTSQLHGFRLEDHYFSHWIAL